MVTALRGEGIGNLLIKGPVLAHRLYSDGASRPYLDSDLLVDPARFAEAERVLQRRGFVRIAAEEDELPEWAQHGHELMRPQEGICVELHWTLMHYAVAPARVWEAFNRDSRELRVGGVSVAVPGDPQLALHTAIHVAEHGAMGSVAEDLRRAIDQFPFETWAQASALARELRASAAFAAGLAMVERGAALAARLGLAQASVAAFSLERLARARGWRGKAGVALRIAFPEPAYMRSFERPLASRGRTGLALAYAWRPVELALRAPAAVISLRRVRRAQARGS